MSNQPFERERRFAQKIANIFLGDYKVKVGQGDLNIAYCVVPDKNIFFDFPKVFIGDDKVKEMMDFKGYAFHEILHLKYTTRIKTADRHRLKSKSFDGLMQRLEDGRIETLGVLRYQKLADYLIHAVNSYILKDKHRILKNTNDELVNAFILLYGRSIYFPDKELIAKIRELLIKTYGKDLTDRLETDIDAYILENLPSKRFKIARDLYDYLYNKGIMPNFQKGMKSVVWEKGRELKKLPKELEELEEKLPKLKEKREEILKEIQEMTPEINEEEDKKEKEEKQEKIEEEKEEIRQELEEKEEEIDKKWEEWDNTDDDEKSAEIRTEIDDLEKEKEELEAREENLDEAKDSDISEDDEDELDQMIENKQFENEDLQEENREEINRDLKSVGQITEAVFSDDTFIVDGDMKRNSRRLERGINKLNTEMKQGYVDKQKSGKLNVRRYLNKKNQTDINIFKKWLPDQIKKTKMLINIFIDGSGSMRGERWETTLGALWIINEAFNKDDNKVMAYQFSRDFTKIKGYDDKLSRPTFMGNYTYVAGALRDAIPQIEAYRKANNFKNVINMVITDGAIQDEEDTVNVELKEMDNLKHHTILVNVAHKPSEFDKKFNWKHNIYVENFDDLTPKLINIFSKIKKSLIKQVMM